MTNNFKLKKRVYQKYCETQFILSHIIWDILSDVKVWVNSHKDNTVSLGYGNFRLTKYCAHADAVSADVKCNLDYQTEFTFNIPIKFILGKYTKEELKTFQKEIGDECIMYDFSQKGKEDE